MYRPPPVYDSWRPSDGGRSCHDRSRDDRSWERPVSHHQPDEPFSRTRDYYKADTYRPNNSRPYVESSRTPRVHARERSGRDNERDWRARPQEQRNYAADQRHRAQEMQGGYGGYNGSTSYGERKSYAEHWRDVAYGGGPDMKDAYAEPSGDVTYDRHHHGAGYDYRVDGRDKGYDRQREGRTPFTGPRSSSPSYGSGFGQRPSRYSPPLPPFSSTINASARSYTTRANGDYSPRPFPTASSAAYQVRERDVRRNTPPFSSMSAQPSGPGANTPVLSSTSAGEPRGGKNKPKAKPFLPAPDYIQLSHPSRAYEPATSSSSTKLLVLDLNGALVYRPSTRVSYPRPYLGNFLSYIFEAEPIAGNAHHRSTPSRPVEAFVWSSAQPQNVRLMVDKAFGPVWNEDVWGEKQGPDAEQQRAERRMRGQGRLMGVWARDKMKLPKDQYNQHVATVKDLRDLHAGIRDTQDIPLDSDIHYCQYAFDESNTILLDDSTAKALHQPWNHICLPEYDADEHKTSQAVAQGQKGELDEYLLCIIGILDEMRHVSNVPAWTRSGGLVSRSRWDGRRGLGDPTLETLPSHDSHEQWYKIPDMVTHWRNKGIAALERKGIRVDPAVDMTTWQQQTRQSPPPDARTTAENVEATNGQHTAKTKNAVRAYSPSLPQSPDEDTGLQQDHGATSRRSASLKTKKAAAASRIPHLKNPNTPRAPPNPVSTSDLDARLDGLQIPRSSEGASEQGEGDEEQTKAPKKQGKKTRRRVRQREKKTQQDNEPTA